MNKRKLLGSLLIIFLVMGLIYAVEEGNVITAMSSNSNSFLAVQPLDFSSILSAGAFQSKDGTKLQVCLSNADFDITQMSNDYVIPITEKSQFIAVIKFSNARQENIAGTYNANAGYGKPFWGYAEIKLYNGDKGVMVSLGVNEGTAVITEKTADHIKGTFDLRSVTKSGKNAELTGTFDCPLTTSKW